MNSQSASDGDIERAAALLRDGKLVAFPTETVYGLGADATNDEAVTSIYTAKGRPSTNPLIVHVASFESLLTCVDLSDPKTSKRIAADLHALSPLWPGPLSVVVPRASHISPVVSAGGTSVALRIPRHPIALNLLEVCGRPVAAPSANPSNYISPTTAEHVRKGLGDRVAYVLDGGPCEVGIESTVVSLIDETPVILRPGAITKDDLEGALGRPVRVNTTGENSASTARLSPGMLAKHYSPHTPVVLMSSISPSTQLPTRTGVITFSSSTPISFTPTEKRVISERGDLAEVAARLFAALQELDEATLDVIVVDTCEPIGLGAAIMDRLIRAACTS